MFGKNQANIQGNIHSIMLDTGLMFATSVYLTSFGLTDLLSFQVCLGMSHLPHLTSSGLAPV